MMGSIKKNIPAEMIKGITKFIGGLLNRFGKPQDLLHSHGSLSWLLVKAILMPKSSGPGNAPKTGGMGPMAGLSKIEMKMY
jgi:hypothetical protein